MKLLPPGPPRPARALVECACREAAGLSGEVGIEQLVLAVALLGETLAEYGADADAVRDHVRVREHDALASLGISPRRRRHVTPDQLLAALVEHSPRACRLLFELGVPVGTLRERLRC
jgi:hypothetical protein